MSPLTSPVRHRFMVHVFGRFNGVPGQVAMNFQGSQKLLEILCALEAVKAEAVEICAASAITVQNIPTND